MSNIETASPLQYGEFTSHGYRPVGDELNEIILGLTDQMLRTMNEAGYGVTDYTVEYIVKLYTEVFMERWLIGWKATVKTN